MLEWAQTIYSSVSSSISHCHEIFILRTKDICLTKQNYLFSHSFVEFFLIFKTHNALWLGKNLPNLLFTAFIHRHLHFIFTMIITELKKCFHHSLKTKFLLKFYWQMQFVSISQIISTFILMFISLICRANQIIMYAWGHIAI